MRKFLSVLATSIAVILLIFGLLRLLGSVPAVGYVLGWWIPDGEIWGPVADGVEKVRAFLAVNEGILNVSLTAYFMSSLIMGVALVLGALAWLFKRRKAGLVGVGLYVLLWAAMFVNYGVSDATFKLMQLAATAAAWGVLYSVWRSERQAR